MAWTPELAGGAEERVVTVDEERLALWALGADGRAVKVRRWNGTERTRSPVLPASDEMPRLDPLRRQELGSGQLAEGLPSLSSVGKSEGAQACVWDPHDPNKIAVVQGSGLVQWDLRTFKYVHRGSDGGKGCRSRPVCVSPPTPAIGRSTPRPAAQTELAHRGVARDVDFNRSKPYALVTCGEDRLVKFWDSRKPSAPVKHLAGHTHWCVPCKLSFHVYMVVCHVCFCTS